MNTAQTFDPEQIAPRRPSWFAALYAVGAIERDEAGVVGIYQFPAELHARTFSAITGEEDGE